MRLWLPPYSPISHFWRPKPPLSTMSASSPLPPRKRRLRSPSPASPKRRRTDLSVDVCHENTRAACRRSELDCIFAHPHAAVPVVDGKVTACADALRGKCFRGRTCRYYHPLPHIRGPLLRAIGLEGSQPDQVCRDFLKGKCLRPANKCRWAHHVSIDDSAIVCQDFLRGRCERKSCRYMHDQVNEAPQVPFLQYGDVMNLTPPLQIGHDGEVCNDFLMGRCYRNECKYAHPPPQPEVRLLHYGDVMSRPTSFQTGNDMEVIPVCQDFLKNRCYRDNCKYTHPGSPTEGHLLQYGGVTSLPSPPRRIRNDKEVIQVCKDFLKKRCDRDECKYAHPDVLTEVVGNQVEVCRDFNRGECGRSACRFYHPRKRA